MIQRLLSWYTSKLESYPVLSSVVSGFVIAAGGDVIAQVVEQRWSSPQAEWHIDGRRMTQLGCIRSFLIAPFIGFWYPFLARNFTATPVKVLVDQLVGSPIVVSSVFLANEILGGRIPSAEQFTRKVRSDGLTAWCTGLTYWPIVHTVTFGVLPLRHQPVFAHLASVPWNACLSHYANRKID